jgi:hypothetical protein
MTLVSLIHVEAAGFRTTGLPAHDAVGGPGRHGHGSRVIGHPVELPDEHPEDATLLGAGLARLVVRLCNGNVSVFATFMGVAVLIVIARSLAGFEVFLEDLGVAIEAGYRLVAGLGLTHSSFDFLAPLRDIAGPIQRKYLTWYPPFLSLYVAGALFLGLSLVTSLKLLFGLTTLAGWVGWAVIGSRMMRHSIDFKVLTIPAHFVIACLLPLLFTPAWQGTDIILWAGTPFVILLLLSALESATRWRYLVMAGLLTGFLYSVRYTSAYLAVAALLIVAQFHYRDIKRLVSVYACFVAASMVFVLPTALYARYWKEQTEGITEFIRLDPGLVFDNLKNVIYYLSHGLSPYLFWTPESVRLAVFRANDSPALQLGFSVCALLVLVIAPFFIHRYAVGDGRLGRGGAELRLAVALSLTILALPAFLVLASLFMSRELSLTEGWARGLARGFQYVSDLRYYLVCGGASVFIFYYLCTQDAEARWWSSLARRLCAFILVVFMSLGPALPAIAFLLPNNKFLGREWLLLRVAGTRLDRAYPSNEMIRSRETMEVIRQLSAREPKAVFFITTYYHMFFDNFNPQLRYFWIEAARVVFNGAYVSRDTKVYFVLRRYEAEDEAFAMFLARSGFREVMTIPENGAKIFAAQLPAGFSFTSTLTN